ncbi:MAG TPA: TetR/AcrR family transcriptional regulator [Intrasporangium sp.]|nr:TetR/AcrR family transcriptional regulator [Intrasporangium sp.]
MVETKPMPNASGATALTGRVPWAFQYHGRVENSQPAAAARLTARGAKTRSRIVATAADLMRVRGVGGTTLDDVVSASAVSKSQLYRHFEDKPALVRAVIEYVGERTIAGERERLEKVRTFAGLRRWRDALVERNALQEGRYGCPLGSLANEVSDQDWLARRKLHDLFMAWQELFEDLLRRFQRDGVVPQDADVAQLATGFVAAVQGGYLLAQTSRDARAMASAIDMAISHLHLLAREQDEASWRARGASALGTVTS